MKKDWLQTTLNDICTKITDGSHWSPKGINKGIPMASVKDMTDYGFNIETCKNISDQDYQELKKNDCEPLMDDILIAKDGSYLKHIFVWKERIDIAILSSIAILRPDKDLVESEFLARYLMSPIVKAAMSGYVTGAALPRIILEDFKQFRVLLPPLPIQHRIALTLSVYDDLIKNNLHRIQLSEEMVQLIYQEWFVNFRFPGHEEVKFVNSELGKIPEGWEVLELGGILESIESGSRPKGGIDPEERGVPSVGAENVLGLGHYHFGKEKYVSEDFYENMRKGKIRSGDLLLYKDGAKLGRKSMFRDRFPHEVCCINEHVFILRTDSRCSQNYLYFYLDRSDTTEKIINLNANAAQPGINQAGVKSLLVLLPPENLIRLFDNKVDPIIGLLFNLAKKNQILRKKRDLLLPKLISGELDVSDLDIAVQEQEP